MTTFKQLLVAVVAATLVLSPISAFAKGGGFSGGGSRGGFSGGGSKGPSSGGGFKSSPSPSYKAPSSPSPSYKAPSSPSKNFFTSPAPSRPQPSSPPSSTLGTKKPTPSYDNSAVSAKRQEQSREKFQATQSSKTPDRSTTTGSSSSTSKPAPTAMPRGYSSKEWLTRERRKEERFGRDYRSYQPPVVHQYNDSLSPLFWMLLIQSNNTHERDRFVYNHKENIDPARLAELEKTDTGLKERLKALEESGVKKDPKYVPKEFEDDKDLVYSDEVAAEKANESTGFWTYLWASFIVLLSGGALYYLGFVHKFNVRRKPA